MVFRNNKLLFVLLLLLVFLLVYIQYLRGDKGPIIFIVVGATTIPVLCIFGMLEYFRVEENGIVNGFIYFSFMKKEANWNDIKEIYMNADTKYFKSIKIYYRRYDENGRYINKYIIINSGVVNYKNLLSIIVNNSKENSYIRVDKRVIDLINS